MKKVLLIAATVLLISGTAAFALDVSIVPKVGAGVGFITGSDWQAVLDNVGATNSVRFMWSAGAFLDLGLFDGLALQAGAAYTQTGGAYHFPLAGATVNGLVTANLLEVPLMLRPRFGNFYLLVGPEAAWVLGDVVVKEGSITTNDAITDRMIWAGTAGLGYSFPMMGGNAQVELKYTHSFSNIDFTVTGPQSWNLNNAYLSLGYSLPLIGTGR